MPHIKSVRLANVYFNNATQFYDDFRMELGGRNATYDLENGGGKSLLLQMILQTVLPKTYLRKEKPVSLLFQGGKDRTSHVAVDWILDEGSTYKYLLTGFCARKKKGSGDSLPKETNLGETGEDEDSPLSADIEHLNWCVFHNDDRSGIRSAPFVREEAGRKIYAGFDDIRRFIQQVKQKGSPAEIFDRVDRYQRYISAQNLIPAEWNIIRGINGGENSIESYFRQDATSRKLIENQFIKIIEDTEALNKGGKSNEESLLLADTLIEIRGRLSDYLKLKSHMAEFERIKEYYTEFGKRNEDLYSAIKEYESCKAQASGIRNLIGDRLRQLETEKSSTAKSLEDSTKAVKEGRALRRQLEAGLVQYGIDRLTSEKKRQDAERARTAENQKALDDRYAEAMTLEGYGEYRGIREKLHKAEQSLLDLEKNGDELHGQYREAGGRLKFLVEEKIRETASEENKLRETLDKLENEKKANQESHLAAAEKASSLGTEIRILRERETALGRDLKTIQDFFLARGDMDAVTEPGAFLKKTEQETKSYESQKVDACDRSKQADSEFQACKLQAVELNGVIKQKEEEKKRVESWLKAYQNVLDELNGKAAGFGKNGPEEYREGLELLIHQESLRKLELEIEAGRLRQKKRLSEERGCYVPNEEILSLLKKLGEKCEYAAAGIDWIAKLPDPEKETLLKEMPYLPFSVIVDGKSFGKLKNNRLKLDFASDYPVPVVNVETIRSGSDPAKDDIFYVCSFSGLILKKTEYKRYIEGIEARVDGLNKEISDRETRIRDLNNDFLKVSAFFENYSKEKVSEESDRVKEIGGEIKETNKGLAKIMEEENRLLKEKDSLAKQAEELTEKIKESREHEDRLRQSIRIGGELIGVRKELGPKQKELENVKQNIQNITEEADKIDVRCETARAEAEQLKLELYGLQEESKALASFSDIENSELIYEVRARYKSLSEAVSGRIANENVLRGNIDDYKSGLNKLKNRILREHGVDLEQIEEKERGGERIVIPSPETIGKIKADLKKTGKELKSVEGRIHDLSMRISGAEGQLKEILKELPEDAAGDLPRYETEERYREEIQTAAQLIKSYEDEIEGLHGKLDKIEEGIRKLNNQAENYDGFMDREEVAEHSERAEEIRDFRDFESAYLRLQREYKGQSGKWADRVRAVHEETAAFIIREPIEELGKISIPATTAQCLERRGAFREYIMNIEEQMQKIGNDILQLEKYQQDFTRRCVQRAELVLGQLKKLESFSRIEVFGRRTNMIKLELPELEDKEKYLRMKNHIDSIVREISGDGAVDRKKVALKLSTKELLAQITDMDKAAVRLFKVESIPENSRFYRWERAIGSEGQNNSLYFIFAACLISFIRMLSVTNASIKTKKVIIADNPFGATSAVYLWEPMFEIMKQNDIQLIAPGHRIPREITSRFGVNYLLNQEILEDGRIRVVVKDVRAEEDEDMVKYIEPEQLSMLD